MDINTVLTVAAAVGKHTESQSQSSLEKTMDNELFASSTTYVHTIFMACRECKKPTQHYHVRDGKPDLWRCKNCFTIRERKDGQELLSTGTLQSTDPSPDQRQGEGSAHILGYVMDCNGGALPVRDFRSRAVK
jgi:hypothetical protein